MAALVRATWRGTSGWSSEGVDPVEESLKKEPPRVCFLVVERVSSISGIQLVSKTAQRGQMTKRPLTNPSCEIQWHPRWVFRRLRVVSILPRSGVSFPEYHSTLLCMRLPWPLRRSGFLLVCTCAHRGSSMQLTGENAIRNSSLLRTFDC